MLVATAHGAHTSSGGGPAPSLHTQSLFLQGKVPLSQAPTSKGNGKSQSALSPALLHQATLPPAFPNSRDVLGLCMQAGSGATVSFVAGGQGKHDPQGEKPDVLTSQPGPCLRQKSALEPLGPRRPKPQAERWSQGSTEELLVSTLLAPHSWMMRRDSSVYFEQCFPVSELTGC